MIHIKWYRIYVHILQHQQKKFTDGYGHGHGHGTDLSRISFPSSPVMHWLWTRMRLTFLHRCHPTHSVLCTITTTPSLLPTRRRSLTAFASMVKAIRVHQLGGPEASLRKEKKNDSFWVEFGINSYKLLVNDWFMVFFGVLQIIDSWFFQRKYQQKIALFVAGIWSVWCQYVGVRAISDFLLKDRHVGEDEKWMILY